MDVHEAGYRELTIPNRRPGRETSNMTWLNRIFEIRTEGYL
jgi:hypothetical protein